MILCAHPVESFGELGNFRLGQEALDLAHRCFPDAPRRVVGPQAALDGEHEDRADKRATPLPPVAMPDRRFSNGSRPQSVNIAQSRSQMES
jgi:hypothetical protein